MKPAPCSRPNMRCIHDETLLGEFHPSEDPQQREVIANLEHTAGD
jgi:hypothetical protein